jgi:hypothetical protein
MSRIARLDEQSVFINVPFDSRYERLFVALIASLISIGRVPRCVLEISEQGQGRLRRIYEVLRKCRISIHDLCRVGTPVRFNMPFELGLAWSLASYFGNHSFFIFEKKELRLLVTLSDLRGIEPYIHKGSMRGVVNSVLDALASVQNNPDTSQVWRFSIDLWHVACALKHRERRTDIFNRTLFRRLVSAGVELAVKRGFIQP